MAIKPSLLLKHRLPALHHRRDVIAFAQSLREVAAEAFQVWRLKVNPDHSATLACEDGNSKIVFTKEIEFTDFPLDEIAFYFTDNVLMLPSEY